MENTNYIDLLGQYYSEPELDKFLGKLDIVKPPQIPRGERDVTIENTVQGTELTFTNEQSLDISFRKYPEGALVLSNIFFHAVKTDEHNAFQFTLPLNITFEMDKNGIRKLLGKENWTNAKETLLRWDFEKYCISSRFGDDGYLELLGVQLPNKYTMKSK